MLKSKLEKIDFVKFNKERTLINDIFSSSKKNVVVGGWVHNVRELGKIKFILLKDISGIIQITAVKGKVSDEVFNSMSQSRENVIIVSGIVKESKHAPGGKEIV